ncbi:MAG: hypothetical protein JWN15_2739 [Firmicutes bacterium]|nr:hypothetical protein [Bacillota bacterium]
MRRFAGVFLSLVLLAAMAATGSAASAAPAVRVLFDEQEVQFDASPFIAEGQTLVPVRALAERLGFTVGWDERQQKVTLTKGESTILLWVDSRKVVVNGTEATLDVAPKQLGNRTFVPVRFVAERLGARVTWDQNQRTVGVTSGKAFLLKLISQQKPVDQKMTMDLQMHLAMKSPAGVKGDDVNVDIPMHMDMQVYGKDTLIAMTMQLPASMGPVQDSITMQMAMKDGKLYMQDPISEQWTAAGGPGGVPGVPDLTTLMAQKPFGDLDLAKLGADLLKDAVISIAGEEEIDGVKAVRLNVDLSKVNFGALLDKLFASLPLPPGQSKPSFKIEVDRFLVQYWVNPDTQFVHKNTIDIAMGVALSDDATAPSPKIALKAELRSRPVSEPIKFPDFSAPTFTAEQKQAAQTYWDLLQKQVPMDSCMMAASDVNGHWADKSFAAGRDASAKASACFVQQRTALAGLKPPADFADAQTALKLALDASEKAYVALGQAFDLAAKGDLTASDAQKADAIKLSAAADQALMQAAMKMIRAGARYDLH